MFDDAKPMKEHFSTLEQMTCHMSILLILMDIIPSAVRAVSYFFYSLNGVGSVDGFFLFLSRNEISTFFRMYDVSYKQKIPVLS
jgi:hypothetical protein